MRLSKTQQVQDKEYAFPYHYIPQRNPYFSQSLYWGWGMDYSATIDLLSDRLEKNTFTSLIDIGTGDGRLVKELSDKFPEKIIWGVDYSNRAIALAKALNPGLKFKRLDIVKEGIGEQFETGCLVEVLEHIPVDQVGGFVRAVADCLVVGGRLYVTVPHVNGPVQKKHYQHFSLPELERLFKPYFDINECLYLGRHDWQYQILLVILKNRFFILNHPGLLDFIYNFFRKHLFITNKIRCSRVYLQLTKK